MNEATATFDFIGIVTGCLFGLGLSMAVWRGVDYVRARASGDWTEYNATWDTPKDVGR